MRNTNRTVLVTALLIAFLIGVAPLANGQPHSGQASGAELAVVLPELPIGWEMELELYLPPSVRAGAEVRGVIAASKYQGGSLVFTNDAYRALAERLNLAIIRHRIYQHVGGRSRMMSNAEAAALLEKGLVVAAKQTGNAELAYAPLVHTGLSASGHQAVALASQMPERTLAIVGYHTRGMHAHTEAIRTVPAVFLIGGRDSFYSPLVSHLRMVEVRRAGAWPWTAVYQPMVPHAKLGSDELVTAWLEHVITRRLPVGDELADADARPLLRRLDPAGGWLCELIYDPDTELRAQGAESSAIYPAEAFPGDPAEAYWMPNEELARMWLAESVSADERPKLGAESLGSAERPVPVARAPQSIQIDADPTDWTGVAALPAPFNDLERGSLKLAWNNTGLFGLAVVQDRQLDIDPEQPWRADSLELFLDSGFSRARSRAAPNMALESGPQATFRAPWARQYIIAPSEAGDASPCVVHEIKLYRGGGPTQEIPAVWRATDDGYLLEFHIPAGRLAENSLRPGAKIGMNYALKDAGRFGEVFFVQPVQGAHAIPALWGAIVLTD